MDTVSLISNESLAIALLEINSNTNIGPYDDDGETKQYCPSVHEIKSPLNVRKSSQTRKQKLS